MSTDSIPTRSLGATGVQVSAIGIGGFHLGKPELPEAESIRIIQTALDSGITFLDNSWVTTTARAKSAWVKRCAEATASGPS